LCRTNRLAERKPANEKHRRQFDAAGDSGRRRANSMSKGRLNQLR
jgi:hypothetical protein